MSLFSKSKSPKYSKIVTIKSVEGAKDSIDKLYNEYRSAKTHNKKRHIARVAMQAANRAIVSSRRKNLDPLVKMRLLQIHGLYKSAADQFYASL